MYSQDQINFISEKVKQLPKAEKEVIRLVFWEGCDGYRACRALGITIDQFLKIRKKALDSLKKTYDEEFTGEEALLWW